MSPTILVLPAYAVTALWRFRASAGPLRERSFGRTFVYGPAERPVLARESSSHPWRPAAWTAAADGVPFQVVFGFPCAAARASLLPEKGFLIWTRAARRAAEADGVDAGLFDASGDAAVEVGGAWSRTRRFGLAGVVPLGPETVPLLARDGFAAVGGVPESPHVLLAALKTGNVGFAEFGALVAEVGWVARGQGDGLVVYRAVPQALSSAKLAEVAARHGVEIPEPPSLDPIHPVVERPVDLARLPAEPRSVTVRGMALTEPDRVLNPSIERLSLVDVQAGPLHGLADLPKLSALELVRTSAPDLEKTLARCLALQRLSVVEGCFSEFGWLDGHVALRELRLGDTAFADVARLASLTSLQVLKADGTDLDRVPVLPGLVALDLSGCPLTSLIGLEAMSLERLRLSSVRLEDWGPIEALGGLTALALDRTNLQDTAWLMRQTGLRTLDVSGWTELVLPDAPLKDLTYRDGADVDLTRLPTTLEALDLTYTKADLAPGLSRLTQLKQLDLSFTATTSLTGLAALGLERLSLRHTDVRDLSPLREAPRLRRLDLRGCSAVFDVETLAALPELECLHVDWACLDHVPDVLARHQVVWAPPT